MFVRKSKQNKQKNKPQQIVEVYKSDRERIRTFDRLLRRQMLYPAELRDLAKFMSGWQDSNLRPPRPKRGAITGLRYTPRWRRDRDSNPGDVCTSTD